MKTALDVPDDPMRDVKMRAVMQGRKLKDVRSDLLRRGLEATEEPRRLAHVRFARDPVSGLEVIVGGHRPRAGEELTSGRLSEILPQQEADWNVEAPRQ